MTAYGAWTRIPLDATICASHWVKLTTAPLLMA